MVLFKRKIFMISFILTTLSNIYRGLSPWTQIYLHVWGIPYQYLWFYRDLIQLLGYGITLITILAGYRLGKTSDLENEYMDYVKVLITGWIFSTVLIFALFLSPNENIRQNAFGLVLQSASLGSNVCAYIFSGIVLGWLIDDGFKISRTWNLEVRKPVLVYYSIFLVKSLILQVLFSHFLGQIGNSNIRAYGSYSTLLHGLSYPVWIWYLSKMLSAGRKVDLREDYGSILFTIGGHSVAVMSLISFSQAVFNWDVNGLMDILQFMLSYVLKLIGNILGVFGIAFTLVCFGYLHSKLKLNAHI